MTICETRNITVSTRTIFVPRGKTQDWCFKPAHCTSKNSLRIFLVVRLLWVLLFLNELISFIAAYSELSFSLLSKWISHKCKGLLRWWVAIVLYWFGHWSNLFLAGFPVRQFLDHITSVTRNVLCNVGRLAVLLLILTLLIACYGTAYSIKVTKSATIK